MQYRKIVTGCWTAILVFTTLVSICANAWEVYNEDDTTSNQITPDELFIPVTRSSPRATRKLAVSSETVDISRKTDQQHKSISTNDNNNSKRLSSRMETPTLKGTILDPDSPSSLSETVDSVPKHHKGHGPKSIHSDQNSEENIVRGLDFVEEVDGDMSIETDDRALRQFRQSDSNEDGDLSSAQNVKHLDSSVHKTGRHEIQRQKKVAQLRKLKNVDFVSLDLTIEHPQRHNNQQLLQQQQQQQPPSQQQQQHQAQEHQQDRETSKEENHQARELLEFEPEVIGDEPITDNIELDSLDFVEEIFKPDGGQLQGPVGPDCPPNAKTWECLMFAEDLVAFKNDQNLSGHHRVKRQSDGTGNTDEDLVASGDGAADLYPGTEDKTPDLPLKQSLTFNDNGEQTFDPEAFQRELINQLAEKYKNAPGFNGLSVASITRKPDGTVEANVTLKFNPAEYSTLTNDQYLDTLKGGLETIGNSLSNDLSVGGRAVVSQSNPTDLVNQASSILDDPCSVDQCPSGFHQCQAVGNMQVRCQHKCATFEGSQPCQHSSTCELDGNSEPFCACTKRWTGTYCQQPVKDNQLDEGEITGVTFGAALLAAGVIGALAWFLLCRRKTKDPIFTHYSDEEGSGTFSNPSSKLSNFVIDRPKISIAPINTFNPNNSGSNLSRRSSSDNSGGFRPQRPSRPRFSNA